MDSRRTFLATGCLVALCALAPAQMALAQSAPAAAPVLEMEHVLPVVSAGEVGSAGNLAQFANLPAPGGVKLNFASPGGAVAHILPTTAGAMARAKALSGRIVTPLTYHAGGKIMTPNVLIYTIYWKPPTLQNGAATGFSANYMTVQNRLAAWYQGHGLGNVNPNITRSFPARPLAAPTRRRRGTA